MAHKISWILLKDLEYQENFLHMDSIAGLCKQSNTFNLTDIDVININCLLLFIIIKTIIIIINIPVTRLLHD